jgi:hypothetical protein
MQVVHQHHNRAARHQAAEERQPVLHVDHEVRRHPEQEPQRVPVHREVIATPVEFDATDDLPPPPAGICRATDRDAITTVR